MKQPVVELRQIKKHFGTVKANDGVDLRVFAGEIHAILGENGSGKSTLMNILSGLYAPDAGEIRMDGQPISIRSPKDAMDKGIGMIHQHFKLVEALTAWENIVGGMQGQLFLRRREVVRQIGELCRKYHLQMDPEKKVYEMTIGEKQTVEIVKALYRKARIMILDEPTAVLTAQETGRLFEILREMRANGCAVIIITHKLQEVMDISDRVTVLRKGVSVCSMPTAEATPEQLAELMVGRAIDISVPYVEIQEKKEPVLSIRDLRITDKATHTDRLSIDALDICSYEILGVAGVADSGQKELCEAIAGLRPVQSGLMIHKGDNIVGLSPKAILEKGISMSFIPEDRLGMGLANGLSISENVVLRTYRSGKSIFLDRKEELRQANDLVERYSISTSGVQQAIQSLSGGNIQKVLLGREINRNTDFLMVAYPVRGLDIGASDFIYERLNEEKKKGVAILMIGEDLDVLLGICDRIAVLHSGRLMDVVDAKTATKEQLGLLMMGQEVRHVEN
ncbi:MAG: ABC transporter ATP-binding protein [Clostridiales bacterium]|nr:ABC transporter ATP-binding protein [Clostridiales bacterium]